MSIEVEIRGQMSEEKFNEVKKTLSEASERSWEDDRNAAFFVIPNVNLKVSKYVSKGTAKIAFKNAHESAKSAEEIEIPIQGDDYEKIIRIFEELGFNKYNRTEQKRTNYIYKEVEIAIKWSRDWSYHFEMEKVVEQESEVEQAQSELNQLAKELGLIPMTENEIKALIENINKNNNLN